MKIKIKLVVCHDIEGNEYMVSSSDLSFRPAVYAIIVEDNKILLSKQWDGYDFPGGGVELGENTLDALVREVKEETGIDAKPVKIIFANNSFFKLPFGGKFVHSIHMYYLCEKVGGELSTDYLDDQEKKYADHPEWVDLNDVPNIKICSSIKASEVLENL